jgi:hypothetical protein
MNCPYSEFRRLHNGMSINDALQLSPNTSQYGSVSSSLAVETAAIETKSAYAD